MRFATPLIAHTDGSADRLDRLNLQADGEGSFSEAWLQRLIDKHPTVLPIEDIENGFTPAVSACIELPLTSGFLDNLLVTPSGNLIAVECKLWRNYEARRKVVAQIIDYAKDLQRLRYEGLQQAIRIARKEPEFVLHAHVAASVSDAEPILDEPRFVDTVSRNLARGRSLLLIVGDGVHLETEAMTEFLQQHAGLHFGLAIVQLGVYEAAGSGQRIVVPSIPIRTTNITRGIVEVRDGQATILPPPAALASVGATTLTEDQFMSGLDAAQPETSERLREFLDNQQDLGVQYEVLKTLVVRMRVGEVNAVPFVVYPDGLVDTCFTFIGKELYHAYAERLAAAIPGAVLKETPKSWYVPRKKADGTRLTIWNFLDHADGVRTSLIALYNSLSPEYSGSAAGEKKSPELVAAGSSEKAGEMFYIDENGNKADAEFFPELLDGP